MDNITSIFTLIFFIIASASFDANSTVTFSDSVAVNGKLTVTNTDKGAHPCPSMTQTQRDAIAVKSTGDCVINTTTGYLNVYNGSTWEVLTTAGAGNVTGVASSVDGEIVLFDSTTGKLIKRATGSGFVKATSGVYSTSSNVNLASEATGVLPLVNGGTNKNMTAVAGGVVYTDADSQEVTSAGTTGQYLKSNGSSAPAWTSLPYLGTIGATNGDVQAVQFGGNSSCTASCTTGTCNICSRVGTSITSVTWQATGDYKVNGIDGTDYFCVGSGAGTGFAAMYQNVSASTASYAYITFLTTGSANHNALANIACFGTP